MATIKTDVITPTATAYIPISTEANNQEGTGLVVTYRYRGSKAALRLASYQWVAAGGKYSIVEDGPYSVATVTYSGPSAILKETNPQPITQSELLGEEPATRFEFRTEYYDASIFELPLARKESAEWERFYSISTPPAPTKADYFSRIRLAGEDPNSQSFQFEVNGTSFPVAKQLALMWARGQQSFQSHKVSLSKVSSYSALNGLPATPPIISSIYSGDYLAILNDFPDIVKAVMPKPPTTAILTPEGTTWAWLKVNDSTSLIVKTNQVERNETWTFAAWDTFVYPLNLTN
jgi:hypothetical protein